MTIVHEFQPEHLGAERTRLGMTQVQFAALLSDLIGEHVSQDSVSKYERGLTPIPAPWLVGQALSCVRTANKRATIRGFVGPLALTLASWRRWDAERRQYRDYCRAFYQDFSELREGATKEQAQMNAARALIDRLRDIARTAAPSSRGRRLRALG